MPIQTTSPDWHLTSCPALFKNCLESPFVAGAAISRQFKVTFRHVWPFGNGTTVHGLVNALARNALHIRDVALRVRRHPLLIDGDEVLHIARAVFDQLLAEGAFAPHSVGATLLRGEEAQTTQRGNGGWRKWKETQRCGGGGGEIHLWQIFARATC